MHFKERNEANTRKNTPSPSQIELNVLSVVGNTHVLDTPHAPTGDRCGNGGDGGRYTYAYQGHDTQSNLEINNVGFLCISIAASRQIKGSQQGKDRAGVGQG